MATQDNIVPAADAGPRFPELLEVVRGGGVVTIVRDGVAVAKLVPVGQGETTTPEEREQAIRRLLEMRKGVKPLGVSVKELVNEGRL